MKRLLILAILCSLSFTGLTAQIRYCMSYADYQEGKWTELDTLKLKGRNKNHRIKIENDSLNEVIKDEAFAVLYHDTLLVNKAHMYYNGERFGKGYAPAFIYRDGQILFVSRLPHEKDVAGTPAVFTFSVMFGAIGGVLVAGAYAAANDGQYCFLVKREYEGGRKEARMIDDKYMKRFEEKSPEFYADYMSAKKNQRNSAANILRVFRHWRLIS